MKMQRGMYGVLAVLALACSTAASAQAPPFSRFAQQRGPLTIVNVPLSVLETNLKLTPDQKSKIAQLQGRLAQQQRAAMSSSGDPNSGPPDPEERRARFARVRTLETEAVQNIEAILTADQRQAEPVLIKKVRTFRSAGLPAELISTLQLSSDQEQQISDVVKEAEQDAQDEMQQAQQSGDRAAMRSIMEEQRKTSHSRTMAILTADQRTMVEKYIQDHPMPERNGNGGPPPGIDL